MSNDRKTNELIRNKTQVKDIVRQISTLNWQSAGHLVRGTDNRWSNRVATKNRKKGSRKTLIQMGRQYRECGGNLMDAASMVQTKEGVHTPMVIKIMMMNLFHTSLDTLRNRRFYNI